MPPRKMRTTAKTKVSMILLKQTKDINKGGYYYRTYTQAPHVVMFPIGRVTVYRRCKYRNKSLMKLNDEEILRALSKKGGPFYLIFNGTKNE